MGACPQDAIRKIRKRTCLAACGLFLLALVLPAVYTYIHYPGMLEPPQPKATPGWVLLRYGWGAILHGTIAWFANPLFLWLAVMFCHADGRYDRKCARVSRVSLYIAASAWLTAGFYRFHDGGAYTEHFHHFGIGAYCWLAAFVVLFLGVRSVCSHAHPDDASTGWKADSACERGNIRHYFPCRFLLSFGMECHAASRGNQKKARAAGMLRTCT
jgi:hypothetical protein